MLWVLIKKLMKAMMNEGLPYRVTKKFANTGISVDMMRLLREYYENNV